jgi:tRNA (guanine-N7-)-methyltransferase
MAKQKLERFAEIAEFPNVFHLTYENLKSDFPLKGKWNESYFKNNQPLILELGCGKGEYTIGLAEKFPGKNFIGVDIKGNRMWVGAKAALENKISNAAFLRTRIDFIEYCFGKDEVSEIWITFPDPQPQKPRERKRLTAPMFLDRYKKFLKPGGIIHLKTDSQMLYNYTLEVIEQNNYDLLDSTNDLYNAPANEDHENARSIKTYYEQRFLKENLKICYLKFTF